MSRRNENRPGYKKTKVGWLPRDWHLEHLEKCAQVSFSTVDKLIIDQEQQVRLCNYTDVYYNVNITDDLPYMVATATEKEIKRYALQKGDVIITKDSETADDIAVPAYVAENLDSVICGYHLALIRPRGDLLIGEYLSLVFQSHAFRHYFSTLANGVTRFGLTLTSTRGALVPRPTIPEQKKIAEILSAWDRAMEQTQKLIVAKKQLKKGLMQQLLTGRMRFAGFGKAVTNKGDLPIGWRVKKLNNVSVVSFSGVDKKTYHDQNNVQLCNYMDVYSNEYITADLDFMPSTASDTEISKFALGRGDVLITKDSETPEDIGVPAVVSEKLENVICGYHLALIRPDPKLIDSIFLAKSIANEGIRKKLSRLANGVTRFGLTTSSLNHLEIRQPDISEQRRISGVILICDIEINLLLERASLLVEQKKGLMQKLLTGEVRIKIDKQVAQ